MPAVCALALPAASTSRQQKESLSYTLTTSPNTKLVRINTTCIKIHATAAVTYSPCKQMRRHIPSQGRGYKCRATATRTRAPAVRAAAIYCAFSSLSPVGHLLQTRKKIVRKER